MDIDGIELLRKAEKIDDSVNVAADRILDDRALKKIKILKLKEGVKKVDRHGFRDDDKMITDAQNAEIRKEYFAKILMLNELKKKK